MRLWLSMAALAVAGAAFWPSGAGAQEEPVPKDPTARDLDSYRLHVEDEVEISLYKTGSLTTDFSRTFVVPANGEVSLAPIGKVNLKGRTPDEVKTVVEEGLKAAGILKDPKVGCFILKYAPRTVSVIGAVRKSVVLPIHRDLRILELLSLCGGLGTEGADFSKVEIRRIGADGAVFHMTVDVDAVFQGTDERPNIVVREGDYVYVPALETATPQSSEFVYSLGNVRNVARVPMIRGRMTLARFISMCGGFTEFANTSRIKIIRQTETGQVPIVVDFDDILENRRPDVELKPDDIVYVPESFL